MGIRGLTTFIDSNPCLLSSHSLANTQVIVDGNNLAHILYHDSGVECFLGGDYDVFYKRAKRYFAVYRKCNISPIIIFDGGYDYSDRKLKTTYERNADRLQIVCSQQRGHRLAKNLFPIMALEVFRDVLIDMAIPFMQCDFEADDQVAALANYFGCPVLSLDSDFYIFDLKGGFIPLNTIDTQARQKSMDGETFHYLECQIYFVENFLQCFQGLDRSVLPLFGTIVGNDFVNINTFNRFFDQIKLPKVKSKKLHIGQRQKKMIGLLCWLQSQTVEEAVEQIVGFLKAKDRPRVKEMIFKNIEGYTKCKSTLLQALGLEHAESEQKVYQLKTKRGEILPEKFSESFSQAVLPPFMLNAVGLHRIFLLPHIEHLPSPSSYTTSLFIRKVIYSILLSQPTEDSKNANAPSPVIMEFDRKDYLLEKKRVSPENSLPKFGKLPSLKEIPNLTKTMARNLVFEVLGVDEKFYHSLPSNLQLPLMIMKYWVCNADPKVTKHHITSALMCLTYLMFVTHSDIVNDIKENTSETILLLEKMTLTSQVVEDCHRISTTGLQHASSFTKTIKNNLGKFFHKLEQKQKQSVDIVALHGFSQLQTCLLFSSYLNRLLQFPFSHLRIEFIFNGTFLYMFYKELERKPCPELYISEMLVRNSPFDEFFIKVQKFLLERIPEEAILPQQISKIRRRKKKRQTNNSNEFREKDADEDVEAVDSDEVKTVKKIQSRVTLENKFQELMNSDDTNFSVEFEKLSDDSS